VSDYSPSTSSLCFKGLIYVFGFVLVPSLVDTRRISNLGIKRVEVIARCATFKCNSFYKVRRY
jgi:hypothetical protein